MRFVLQPHFYQTNWFRAALRGDFADTAVGRLPVPRPATGGTSSTCVWKSA